MKPASDYQESMGQGWSESGARAPRADLPSVDECEAMTATAASACGLHRERIVEPASFRGRQSVFMLVPATRSGVEVGIRACVEFINAHAPRAFMSSGVGMLIRRGALDPPAYTHAENAEPHVRIGAAYYTERPTAQSDEVRA